MEKFRKSPRRVPVFLESLKAESVFICRYLTPMRPPDKIFKSGRPDEPKAPERAARFVSLIPWVGDSPLFKDMPDLTCLSQEFLDLGVGGSEEHAILLCNYFNYIDRASGAQEAGGAEESGPQSYIVYGQAIPDGTCWYVARIDGDGFVELWDPRAGECYVFAQSAKKDRRDGGRGAPEGTGQRAHDPICPLKKIWAIVGPENVWANIQQAEAPVLMRFDLADKKCWAPFLDQKSTFFRGLKVQDDPKVQVNAPDLKYAPPADRDKVRRLEQSLRKYLISKFEEERIAEVRKTTNWNLALGERAKAVLGADPDVKELAEKEIAPALRAEDVRAKLKKGNVGEQARALLLDFEEYMLQARRGGTNSRLRGAGARMDEDIQASLAQRTLADLAGAADGRKHFWAVPLNTTFSSQDAVWDLVKNTRAHEIDHQEVEFSLSVMLAPYPSNVFSVWVYISVLRDAPAEAIPSREGGRPRRY